MACVSGKFWTLAGLCLLAGSAIGIMWARSDCRKLEDNATTQTLSHTGEERMGSVTFKGNPVTLVGNEVAVGDSAPEFALAANDLSTVDLAATAGKVRIISVVPSLDTPTCDAQTRRFNQEAAALGPDVAILTVSMDLPFAQKRWCAAAGITAVQTLSDYKDHSFGVAYGVRIKELGLLARSVFVVDRAGKVTYREIVSEVTHEPDYARAIEAARKAL